MENKRHNYKFVYRHSSLLLKCAVLAAIVVSVVALTVIRINIDRANARTDAARSQAARVEREIAHTQVLTQEKDTVEGSKHIATERLGLVDPGTVYYQVTNQD